MGFFYLIHHLNWGKDLEDGKRNCRTALMGSFCYSVVSVLLRQFHHSFGVFIDGFITGLLIILFTDLCVMAYIYKAYYGRLILHEMDAEDQDPSKWVFDKTTHKYRRPTADDIANAKEDEARAIRTKKIRASKKRTRSAVYIQRWWRDRLYRPPNGILYKRAQEEWIKRA